MSENVVLTYEKIKIKNLNFVFNEKDESYFDENYFEMLNIKDSIKKTSYFSFSCDKNKDKEYIFLLGIQIINDKDEKVDKFFYKVYFKDDCILIDSKYDIKQNKIHFHETLNNCTICVAFDNLTIDNILYKKVPLFFSKGKYRLEFNTNVEIKQYLIKKYENYYKNKKKVLNKEISHKLNDILDEVYKVSQIRLEDEEKDSEQFCSFNYYKFECIDYNSLNQDANQYKFYIKNFSLDDAEKVLNEVTYLCIKNENHKDIKTEYIKYEIDKGELLIILSLKDINILEIPKNGYITYFFDSSQFDKRKNAVYKLKEYYDNPLQRIYENNNVYNKNIDNIGCLNISDLLEDNNYNDSQKEAIKKGCSLNNNALLVLGPPGSGKTTVIVNWIMYYVSLGKKVLVTSLSNMAVDNALEGVLSEKKTKKFIELHKRNIEVARVGKIEKISSDIVRNNFYDKKREDLQKNIKKNITSKREKLRNECNIIQKGLNEAKIVVNEFKNINHNKIFLKKIDKNEDIIKKSNEKKYDFECKIEKFKRNNYFFKILKILTLYIIYIILRYFYYIVNIFFKEKGNKHLNVKNHKVFYKDNINTIKNSYNHFKTINVYNDSRLKEEYNDVLILFKRFVKRKSKRESIQTYNELNKKINEFYSLYNSLCENVKNRLTYLSEYESELDKHIRDFENLLISNLDVVGATCIGIDNKEFRNIDFDVVIIDEAGQILVDDILVPISKAKENLIMVGDHLQIPPVSPNVASKKEVLEGYIDSSFIEKESIDYYKKSYFEILYNYFEKNSEEHISKLNIQYRMPNSICKFLSNEFYNGNYYSCESKMKVLPLLNFKSNFLLIDEGNSTDSSDENGGYYNLAECDIIKKLMEKNYNKIKNKYTLGIISAYNSQQKHTKEALKDIISEEDINEYVKTLDSFQGQEKDIIIFSFVRSNPKYKIGFLKELRRLNVALSRVKYQMICIGNFSFLCSLKDFKDKETKRFGNFINNIYEEALKNKKDKFSVMIDNTYKKV